MRQAVGLDIPQRVFTWLYRRLGKRYPVALMAVELQTAWFITVGLLGLLSPYYDARRRATSFRSSQSRSV